MLHRVGARTLDRPHHDQLGRAVGQHDVRAHAHVLLHSALLARRCRSRIFSWDHPLPDLLVSAISARKNHRHVHDRHSHGRRHRRTAVRLDHGLNGTVRHGYSAWQWLFLLEAIPSIIAGVAVLFYLSDGISDAKWLNSEQKELLVRNLEREKGHAEVHSAFGAFRNRRVWVLCAGYFGFMMGLYGISFWLPSLIKGSGIDNPVHVALLTTIPYAAATLAMIFTGRSADRYKERRWHAAIPALLGAAGLVLSTFTTHNPMIAIVFLSIATMGIMTGLCQFWCLPPAFLGGIAAAAGIAMINSVGNLAGFISPYLIGWVKDVTQSTDIGLYCVAGSLVFAAFICLTMPKAIVNR